MVQRRDTRQTIVESAVALLAAHGFEGFSAAALAEAAGVSKATLFHHFSSLEEIVFEAFEQFAMGLEMLAPRDGITFRQWLQGIGQAQFGLDEASHGLARAYFVFVARALFDERLRRRVLGTVEAANEAFCDAVSALYPGELSHAQVRALGALIFTTADGMAIHLHAFPERRGDILAAWEMFVSRIVPETDDEESGK